MKLVLIFAITMALACFTNASFNPPHYSQKDPKWGRNTLGFGSYTISQKGCFLSVITSMIASQGIEVNGAIPNPGTMNSWFKANDGFKSGLLLYGAAEKFGFTHEGFTTSKSESIKAFNEGKFILLHVEHKSHWVLVTDYDSEGYSVMDPADVRTTYDYNEVNEVAIYSAPEDSSAEPTSDFKFKSTSEPTFELTPEPTLERASASTSTSIPHYSQKDSRWGGETLGLGSYTIYQKGCFLSCITSIVASEGIKVNGVIPNPSIMNKWFKANDGFKRGLLLYKAAEKLGFTYEGFATSKREIINALNEGKYVLLHVENGSHWVVATDYDSNGYSVMDPADVRTSYDYNEVPEVAIYSYE